MNKLLYIAAMGIGLCSCSGNEAELTSATSFPEDHVIRVVAQVNEPQSRAGYDATNLDRFGIIVRNDANSTYNYHKQMVASDNSWSTSDGQPMLWDAERTPVTVTAYAPYKSGAETNTTLAVSVLADQSTDANVKASDFLVSKTTVDPDKDLTTDGKMKISLDHAMSKLLIKVTVNGTDAATMAKLSDLAVNGAVTEGTCNLSADIPTVTASASVSAATVSPYKGSDAYECILPPQTVNNGFSVNFSYDGKLYTWEADAPVLMEKGVEYTLTLNVNKTVRMASQTARNRSTGEIITRN